MEIPCIERNLAAASAAVSIAYEVMALEPGPKPVVPLTRWCAGTSNEDLTRLSKYFDLAPDMPEVEWPEKIWHLPVADVMREVEGPDGIYARFFARKPDDPGWYQKLERLYCQGETWRTALNPYDWQSHEPVVSIPRLEVSQVTARLARGGSVVLFGGRGMGKIWGRPEAREAQRQVESYWTTGVAAGAVVQLTDAGAADWPAAYRRECLEGRGLEIEEVSLGETPLRARFACQSKTADGFKASVDHLLLRLPRRAASGAGSQLAGSPVRREDPGREGPQVIRSAS